MAGYSGTPLIKKLGVKEGFNVGLVNAPTTFRKDLGKLPADSKIVARLTPPLDLILLFAESATALDSRFAILAEKLSANGSLWVAWPKKSSGVLTDLSFNVVQRIGLDCGLVDVKICAIDEIWSGLKFVYRVKDRARRLL
jgi:hypothetical protein